MLQTSSNAKFYLIEEAKFSHVHEEHNLIRWSPRRAHTQFHVPRKELHHLVCVGDILLRVVKDHNRSTMSVNAWHADFPAAV